MSVELFEPIVCRTPGLSFGRLSAFKGPLHQSVLWSCLDDQLVLDCLASMHHTALASLDSRRSKAKPHRPSDTRRAEWTLFRYLTRFCSRNDTTGSAGTTSWLSWEHSERQQSNGPSKSVYPSPRHLELLGALLADGPLQEESLIVANPYLIEDRLPPELRQGLARFKSPQPWKLLEGLDRTLVTTGLANGLLWRKMPDNEPILQSWGELAQGRLREVLLSLEQLRRELALSSDREYVEKMLKADRLVEELGQILQANVPEGRSLYESLDLGTILTWLVVTGQDDDQMLLQLAPNLMYQATDAQGPDRLLDLSRQVALQVPDWAILVVQTCQEPCPASVLKPLWRQVVDLLEQGILTVAGSGCLYGSSWSDNSPALIRALAARPLSGGERGAIAQLLAQAWPLEPLAFSPVLAEYRLRQAVMSKMNPLPVTGKDRSFLVCDAQRGLGEQRLTRGLQQRLAADLQPWFEFSAFSAYRSEMMLQPLLDQLLPPGKVTPLTEFLAQADAAVAAFQPPAFGADFPWEIEYDRANHRVHLVAGELETPQQEAFQAWLRGKRFVSTVDVMLGGSTAQLEAGQGTVLLSEAHAGSEGLPTTIFFPDAHPDWSMAGYASEVFGPDALILQPAEMSKQSRGILTQLQDLFLAVRNPSCPLVGSPEQLIPIGQLMIHKQPGCDPIVSDSLRHYELVTAPWCFGATRLVSFSPQKLSTWMSQCIGSGAEVEGIQRLPAVVLGQLMLCRPMFCLSTSWLSQNFPSFSQQLDLPRYCYFRTDGKPQLLDCQSQISLEILRAELGKSEQIVVSPMLPAAEDLWLQLSDGPYTSELRFLARWTA